MVHAMHECHISGNVDHNISMFEFKMLRKIRQAVFPYFANVVGSLGLVRRNGIVEHGIGRIIRQQFRHVFGFESR